MAFLEKWGPASLPCSYNLSSFCAKSSQAIAELLPEEVVAIDGKTARRSHDCAGGKGAMHLVSAWATQNTLTLGQVRTAEKSNDITAIPQLLDLLDLHGCIVTIDAMGCQREIAQQITDGGANYVLAVKENQGQLHEGIRDLFEGAEALGFDGVPYDYSQTVNKGHGRVERRECWDHHRDGLPGLHQPPRAMAPTEGRHQSGRPS